MLSIFYPVSQIYSGYFWGISTCKKSSLILCLLPIILCPGSCFAKSESDKSLLPLVREVELLRNKMRYTIVRAGRKNGQPLPPHFQSVVNDSEVKNITPEFIESSLKRLNYDLSSVCFAIALREDSELKADKQESTGCTNRMEIGYFDFLKPSVITLFRGALDGRVCGIVNLTDRKPKGEGLVTFQPCGKKLADLSF